MLRRVALSLLVSMVATPVPAEEAVPPREIAGPVEARVLDVRDGDTVSVVAHVWPMQSVNVAVRLRGIDAPEMRGQCAAETAAAEAARARLQALVGDGPVRLTAIAGDKYFGRVLADLSSETEPDLAARLLREGLVARYDGGARHDWCDALVGARAPADQAGRG